MRPMLKILGFADPIDEAGEKYLNKQWLINEIALVSAEEWGNEREIQRCKGIKASIEEMLQKDGRRLLPDTIEQARFLSE